jgi:hypothetical protein
MESLKEQGFKYSNELEYQNVSFRKPSLLLIILFGFLSVAFFESENLLSVGNLFPLLYISSIIYQYYRNKTGKRKCKPCKVELSVINCDNLKKLYTCEKCKRYFTH